MDEEDDMSRILGGVGGSAVLGLFLLATAAQAQDKPEQIKPDKLPPKVMAEVKARFPGAEFTSITKETVEGQVIYDLEMKYKGRKCEMDIREDGTIINIEREIAAKDLPGAVTKALAKKYPKATLKEIMESKVVKGKEELLEGYEVVLETADKKTLEVTLAPDGKIIEEPPAEKQEKPATENQKIEALIKHVEGMKDARFVRNDQAYDAKTAAQFLRAKWNASEGEVKTAKDFIEKVASISSTTGKPYLIRSKDGKEMKSGDFLLAELKKLEQSPIEKRDP
jgi:hypothetical protein